MSSIKNPQRFVELEYTLQTYFDGKVSKVMSAVKDELGSRQADELEAYRRSFAGIVSMATYDMGGDSATSVLRHTGQWNSKTIEDYVAMCQKKLLTDKGFQKDLLTMAAEWRGAVVAQIGRARYDQLSQQLGGDLAYAYVATRMDDLMVEKLVSDNMPRSTADYIIKKAAQGSIWGLEQELAKSPLAQEIEARGEKAFKPGKGAKVAGKLGGSVMDAATMGVTGWKTLATFVGGDMLVNAAIKNKSASEQKEQAMETAISKGVFGSDTNVFTGFRQKAKSLLGKDNQYLNSLNSKLNNKIAVPIKPFMDYNLLDNQQSAWLPTTFPGSSAEPADRTSEKYSDVPLIVAPGQEDAYLETKARVEEEQKAEEVRKAEEARIVAENEQAETTQASQGLSLNETLSANNQSVEATQGNGTATDNTISNTASNGWEQLLQATGMSGMGGTVSNLGYVISMLPDVLIGMFTGKTQSLNMKNTMMPLASILLGMFVKNPLLKMALIGFGGANLLNKAGKESISWQQERTQQGNSQARNGSSVQPQYRQYADEALNPRITNPVLQGTTLIANIDRVPCSIQLTENVVAAYQAGALPLNTLANAILAKYDAQRTAERQYSEVERQTLQQNQTEAIHRSR